MIEDLASRRHVPAVSRFRRDARGTPRGVFRRAERKFDLHAGAGLRFGDGLSNVSPESLGGIDRAATDLHE